MSSARCSGETSSKDLLPSEWSVYCFLFVFGFWYNYNNYNSYNYRIANLWIRDCHTHMVYSCPWWNWMHVPNNYNNIIICKACTLAFPQHGSLSAGIQIINAAGQAANIRKIPLLFLRTLCWVSEDWECRSLAYRLYPRSISWWWSNHMFWRGQTL